MKEKQQTAVQWLYQTWIDSSHWDWDGIDKWFNQALAMEQDQIIKAYDEGWNDRDQVGYEYKEPEQYFTDTYQTEP